MSSFVKASGNIMPNSADPGEEFPFLHTITVVDRVVSVDKPELVQNNIKTETVTLNLDSEWEGLSTVINIGNEKPVSVIWSGEPVVIPAELMTTVGSLDVSVVGYGDDGGIRAVTKQAKNIFNVVASGYVEGDEAVPDPTTILGQLVEAADNANQAADRFNQASEDIGDISNAVSEVKTSADAAKTSETNAASSATAASQSETTAASSASAAKASETNAAASATAAQNAVDGFGLEVGTTTTGEPGTDAYVEIVKDGTKYKANFTIPRGEKGEQGVGGTENVLIGTASGVIAAANDAYSNALRQIRVHGETTPANPEKLVVRTNNFFPNIPSNTQNGITLTQDANGVYHMDGTSTKTERIMWQVAASVPPGDYIFKHSASRSEIDGYVNAPGTGSASSTTGQKVSITSSERATFYVRCAGLQQGIEYHDTVQIVLASGTDIPSDFPKNESSEVALPSDLNLADGDTLVIDSDGSTQITHSSSDPTPSTPVTLPAIPAPTFAVYTEGGLTRPTVDVDYERNINIVINKLEQAMAVQAATMKVNQLTE